MKTLQANIRFKLQYQIPWFFWYLGIYLFTLSITYAALIKTGVLNPYTGSLSYRLWGAGFFLFAISLRFKEDFILLLTLGNPRKKILATFIGDAVFKAAFFAVLIIIEKVVIDILNRELLLHMKDFFHTIAPYSTPNLFFTFLFFFLLFLLLCMFGTLIGSLSYRFGNKFTWGFWLSCTLLPIILIPVVTGLPGDPGALGRLIQNTGKFLSTFSVVKAAGWFVLLNAAAGTGAYLNIRSLEMK